MYRNTFAHTVPTMVALSETTQHLFGSLPAEFTKKEFEAARKLYKGRNEHPLSLEVCREYGLVVVVRTEPTTYTRETEVWTNPVTGEKYDYEGLCDNWSKKLAREFGVTYSPSRFTPYALPSEYAEIEQPAYRNIFAVNAEKVKAFF